MPLRLMVKYPVMLLSLDRCCICWGAATCGKEKSQELFMHLSLQFITALLGCTSVNRENRTRHWLFSIFSALFKTYEDKTCLNVFLSVLFVFSPSLDVCATDQRTKRNIPLTVCKMYALECTGRKYSLTSSDNCKTPQATEKSCGSCHSWERCDGKILHDYKWNCLYEQNEIFIPSYTLQQLCAGMAFPTLPAPSGMHKLLSWFKPSAQCLVAKYGRKTRKTLQETVMEWAIFGKSLFLLPGEWVIPCDVLL